MALGALRQAAIDRVLITYPDLTAIVGGIDRGHGPRLTRIGSACADLGLPLLPILAVSSRTLRPSIRAAFYRERNVVTDDQIDTETQRCWKHDWSDSEVEDIGGILCR
jgi:hypothetical protein